MLLWLANDIILQQLYQPCFNPRLEELLVSSPLSTLLMSCAAHTLQRYHLKLRVVTLLLFPILNVSSTPYSFISQHLNRETHHSSAGSSLKSSPTRCSCWFTALNLNNHHLVYSLHNNLIPKGVITRKKLYFLQILSKVIWRYINTNSHLEEAEN